MNKIITGKDGNMLDPAGTTTRAEAAAMIQRFCDTLEAAADTAKKN